MSKTSVEEFLSCISNHLDKKLLEKLAVAGELTLLYAFAYFTKLFQLNYQHISMILFLQ